MENKPKTYSELIRWKRDCRGISQPKLAQLVGVSVRTIANYERGTTEPRLSDLAALSKILGITPRQFFEGVGR